MKDAYYQLQDGVQVSRETTSARQKTQGNPAVGFGN